MQGYGDDNMGRDPTEITELGILLSKIPIEPRCAKILVVASKCGLLHYGIMIVACMGVTELFDEAAFKRSVLQLASNSKIEEDSNAESDE